MQALILAAVRDVSGRELGPEEDLLQSGLTSIQVGGDVAGASHCLCVAGWEGEEGREGA